MKRILFLCLALIPLAGVAQFLDEGQWRGVIHYEQIDVPFSFKISNNSAQQILTLVNGDEHNIQGELRFENDSIIIPLGVFDAELRAAFKSNSMHGFWKKGYKDNHIPFSAEYDQPVFPTSSTDLSLRERWAIELRQSEFNIYPGVALLEQNESHVSGTILTETSDLRYFEGALIGDSLVMTSFDGAHAFLFTGSKKGNQWEGVMHLDNNYSEKWTAIPDPDATLTDPWELIKVEPHKYRPFFDILAAADDRNINESDYFNKVLVIQLFGTWCPNSLDQTNYLNDWYRTDKPDGVEVLAIAFEPYEKQRSKQRISEYKAHLNLPYEVMLGGGLSKGQAAVAFPFMNKIEAFPTLVILDKLGYVRYVHSYFNGPATGKLYEEFKRSFESKIESLVNE